MVLSNPVRCSPLKARITGEDNRITFVMYARAITFSEHSVHLTNAYFVADDQTLDVSMERVFADDLAQSTEIRWGE